MALATKQSDIEYNPLQEIDAELVNLAIGNARLGVCLLRLIFLSMRYKMSQKSLLAQT